MKVKKIPMRTCVVTKEKYPKKELLRVVSFNGVISVDVTGKANGRGCYLKKDKDVVLTARKNKVLNRVFECEVDDGIYDEIIKYID